MLFLYKRWFIITQYISKCSVVGVIDTIMDEYSNEKKAGFFSRLIDAVLGIFGGGSKKKSDSTAVSTIKAKELSRIDLLEMLVELGKENARLKAEIEDQGREIEKKELLLQAARKNTPVLTTGEEVNLGPSDAQNSEASYRTQMQAAESEARAIDAERRAAEAALRAAEAEQRALKAEAMVEAAELRAREAEEKAADAQLRIQKAESVMMTLAETPAVEDAEADIPVKPHAVAVEPETADVLRNYDDPHWSAYAALTHNRCQNGHAWYLGCDLETEALKTVLSDAAMTAGIQAPALRWPLVYRRRGKHNRPAL